MTLKTKNILAYLAIEEKGDWNRIYERLRSDEVINEKDIDKVVSKIKCSYVTLGEPEYPRCLRDIYHPPFALFYYGDINLLSACGDHGQIAVVGSRKSSEYGERMTRKIVEEVAKEYIIVSGMALGIDAVAAESAIKIGGKTIAVLGCGIDICYPMENYELYQTLKKEQLVISEYPEGIQPSPEKFPLRNRIIAGLAKGVVVTEAGNISGTSITVTLALQSGKLVMCVPYPADEESACNRLIKEGAYLVENGEDVLDYVDSSIS